jgi:hypothetical protein
MHLLHSICLLVTFAETHFGASVATISPMVGKPVEPGFAETDTSHAISIAGLPMTPFWVLPGID